MEKEAENRKVYGRDARIAALLKALQEHPEELPDRCIDLLYSILVNF